jgi:hypothetical protein
MAESLLGFEVSIEGIIISPLLKPKVVGAIEAGVLEIATIEGQANVQSQLYGTAPYKTKGQRHGKQSGVLYAHIGAHGKDKAGALAAQFDAGQGRYGKNLVYSYWVEGVSSRNARSSFKGYRMFRNARKNIASKGSAPIDRYIAPRLMKVFSEGL